MILRRLSVVFKVIGKDHEKLGDTVVLVYLEIKEDGDDKSDVKDQVEDDLEGNHDDKNQISKNRRKNI